MQSIALIGKFIVKLPREYRLRWIGNRGSEFFHHNPRIPGYSYRVYLSIMPSSCCNIGISSLVASSLLFDKLTDRYRCSSYNPKKPSVARGVTSGDWCSGKIFGPISSFSSEPVISGWVTGHRQQLQSQLRSSHNDSIDRTILSGHGLRIVQGRPRAIQHQYPDGILEADVPELLFLDFGCKSINGSTCCSQTLHLSRGSKLGYWDQV